MPTITDSFGFLPINRVIEFDDAAFQPLAGLDETIAAVSANPDEGRRSDRAAHLYKLPLSHTVTLHATPLSSNFRRDDGAFLVHFLGHMFCYRLQFENWWHDGRTPMHGRRWSVLRQSEERRILSTAYSRWRAWQETERTRFTNLLYMHVRSFSYEWDWERFTLRYMVFDGCYKTATALGLRVDRVTHEVRLHAMLSHFQMPEDPAIVSRLVKLRNDLFHEALWDGSQPGTGSREGFSQADNLWRINDRLLFALAGYDGPYLSSAWWNIGQALI